MKIKWIISSTILALSILTLYPPVISADEIAKDLPFTFTANENFKDYELGVMYSDSLNYYTDKYENSPISITFPHFVYAKGLNNDPAYYYQYRPVIRKGETTQVCVKEISVKKTTESVNITFSGNPASDFDCSFEVH